MTKLITKIRNVSHRSLPYTPRMKTIPRKNHKSIKIRLSTIPTIHQSFFKTLNKKINNDQSDQLQLKKFSLNSPAKMNEGSGSELSNEVDPTNQEWNRNLNINNKKRFCHRRLCVYLYLLPLCLILFGSTIAVVLTAVIKASTSISTPIPRTDTTSTSTSTSSTSISTTSKTTSTSTTTTSTTSTSTTTTTTIHAITSNAFWSFDNNVLDLYNNLNAITSGNPTYTTSYLGTGAALNLTRTSSQYAAIKSTQLLLNSTSFTIETWIYPISLTNSDYGIFGQCQINTTNLCMLFLIRNLKLCCSFSNNDLLGSTTLTMNIWLHVACVYNLVTSTLELWINGILDTSHSSSAYQGSSGDTTIGVTYLMSPASNFFNGYIDQMQFTIRAKNATELLNDATLIVYYSFDGGSLYDNGPNGINATAIGNLTTVTGRVNEALQFSSGAYISPSYPAFYLLGVSNYPFTMAFWIKPTGSLVQSAIIFVHFSSTWCIGFVTTKSNGQIMLNLWNGGPYFATGPVLTLNTWSHIGYTYSSSNGIRLYINGTQYSTSGARSYSAAGRAVYLAVGGNGGLNYCSPGYGGIFNGALDEFYLFTRELTAAQIWTLANP